MNKTRIVVLATIRGGAIVHSNLYWTRQAAEGAAAFLREHQWDVVLLDDVRPVQPKDEF